MRGITPVPKPTMERAARVYKTQKAMAEALGISPSRARGLLIEYGIPHPSIRKP